jgi:hypothetical protein
VKGYNIIGTLAPVLSVVTFVSILGLSYYHGVKKRTLAFSLFFALLIYLSLTTTVHPWYIIPLIALGIIINSKTALVWSFFIFLTYFGYSKDGFELSMYWIVLEYVIVFLVFSYEFIYKKIQIS